MNNICVIIPTHNEAAAIGKLVAKIKQMGFAAIIIDDGSEDATGELAETNGAVVLKNEKKMGKGASLRKGFAFALQQPFSAVITMDGDGQHDSAEIPAFIETAKGKEPCLVVGNRFHNPKGMPVIRWLTNLFMSGIVSAVCRQKVADSQCGFRFISMEVLRKIKLKTEKFEIESEILIETSRKGYRIFSAPIQTIYQGEKSKINPFLDTLRFLRFLWGQLWTSPD